MGYFDNYLKNEAGNAQNEMYVYAEIIWKLNSLLPVS